MFPENKKRSQELIKILKKEGFLRQEIGVAVIDFKKASPEIFGYNINNFFYPASVFKIFVGAEILDRIENGEFSLDQKIKIISFPDQKNKIFPTLSKVDLQERKEASLDELLLLMLAKSDNLATNLLVELIGFGTLGKEIIQKYKWSGSGLTDFFRNRIKENRKFRYTETTKLSPRHTAEFFYLVEKEGLVSVFVSKKLKEYMSEWTSSPILNYSPYYKKGGYMENNLYIPGHGFHYKKTGFALDYAIVGFLRLVKTIVTEGWAFRCWVNDSGVVKGEKSNYVLSIFTFNKQISPFKKFKIEKLEKVIYDFMEGN
jgi:hypothetical protein